MLNISNNGIKKNIHTYHYFENVLIHSDFFLKKREKEDIDTYLQLPITSNTCAK